MIREPGRVDPSHWASARERLVADIERWSLLEVAERTDFERRMHYGLRLWLWRVDYSAGVDLVDLRDRFEELLAEWVESGISMTDA